MLKSRQLFFRKVETDLIWQRPEVSEDDFLETISNFFEA